MASSESRHESGKTVRDATCDSLKRIYIVILGLAITQALLRTLSDDHGEFVGIRFWDPDHLTGILLLVAFLPTAIRFAHGGILHLSAFTGVENWRQDMFGLLLQAIFFFITAMSTKDVMLFVMSFCGILIVDSFWLFIIRRSNAPRQMLHQWQFSNAVLFLLSVLLAFLHSVLPQRIPDITVAACLAIASLVATVSDYSRNSDQYFPRETEKPELVEQ